MKDTIIPRNNIALVASNNENCCVGCSSCRHSCPVDAISMSYDSEGFKVPVVDEEKCIDCGKCRTACPVCNPVYDKAQTPRCFAAQASDELRTGKSASGAMFPVLAQEILEKGGVVCGAAWNSEWLCEHIIVDTVEGLEPIKNSKYVQSDLEKCLPEIKRLLEAECPVLFTGTPCQVAALNAYLGKDYQHLYTVDIICHGVPSPMVWKRYLEENFDVDSIKHIAFRDKRKGWTGETFVVEYENGEQVWGSAWGDPYFNGFLQDIMLRKSCCVCPFSKFSRQGDLTIGDYWGIQNAAPEMDDKKGVSVVLENSIKGCLFFDAVKPNLKACRELPLESALPANPNIIQPSSEHPRRGEFFEKIKTQSVTSSLKYYTHDVSACKIINYWFAKNYGASLTCYALQECVKELGYTAKVINYMPESWREKYTGSFSEDFAKKYLDLTKVVKNKNDLARFNEVTDTFITGSDQVFRYDIYNNHGGTAYQLDFAGIDKRKVACAASFGYDKFKSPAFDETLFWHLLHQFDAVSIREQSGVALCRKNAVEAELLMDPVFYLEREKWLGLADANAEEVPEGGILYFLLPYEKEQELPVLEALEKALGVPVIRKEVDGSLSIEAWLDAIRKARFVVTDSFHGTCFSLLMHKPFLTLSSYSEARSRVDQILSKVGLQHRIMAPSNAADHMDTLLTPIDWESVDAVLAQERGRARAWLQEALSKPVQRRDASGSIIAKLAEELRSAKGQITELLQQNAKSAVPSGSAGEIMQHVEFLKDDHMRHIQYIKSQSETTDNYLARMMCLMANERRIKFNYYRCKWISKLAWGKLRKKYFVKRQNLKAKLREIRQFKKTH
ncbi:polysaccharide pyruvyl transferase family protein [Mailhella sp.]